jgi:ketosteroid isomerase-like protein
MEVLMHRIIPLLVILGLFSGCGPRKKSPEEITTEKKAIASLVADYWKAYETKNISAVAKFFTASGDLKFFGTDSAEVINTTAEMEAQKKDDMELLQTVKVGGMKNVSLVLANDGELGSIVCEIPVDMTVGGEQGHSLFRFAGTMRKENGEWRIVHGLVALATVGQSSAELLSKMKAEQGAPAKK